MSGKLTIFLTGSTSYIGGSILWRLFMHRDAAAFNIRALVLNPEKANLVTEKFNIETVIGSHDDSDKLESLAVEADVVISTAGADDLGAARATLRGLKKQNETKGKVPTYIHTSGTAVLADDALGMQVSDKIYDDSKVEDIEALDPKTQAYRGVDIEVIATDQAGYVRTCIVLPSTIYGVAKNALTIAGIQNPHSIQIPILITASIARGQAGMLGQGRNKWPNVHIDDTFHMDAKAFFSVHLGGARRLSRHRSQRKELISILDLQDRLWVLMHVANQPTPSH